MQAVPAALPSASAWPIGAQQNTYYRTLRPPCMAYAALNHADQVLQHPKTARLPLQAVQAGVEKGAPLPTVQLARWHYNL